MQDQKNFKSNIREQFIELGKECGEKHLDKDTLMLRTEKQVMIKLLSTELDFNTGRVIGVISFETPHITSRIKCEEIKTHNARIKFIGKNGEEVIELAVDPNL